LPLAGRIPYLEPECLSGHFQGQTNLKVRQLKMNDLELPYKKFKPYTSISILFLITNDTGCCGIRIIVFGVDL
jgi:hypothetical protein